MCAEAILLMIDACTCVCVPFRNAMCGCYLDERMRLLRLRALHFGVASVTWQTQRLFV